MAKVSDWMFQWYRASPYEDVQVDLTVLAFRKFVGTVALGVIGIVGGSVLVASDLHDPVMWRLVAYLAIFGSLRLVSVIAFSRRDPTELTPRLASLWQLVYGGLTVLYAGALACMTLDAFWHRDATSESLTTFADFAVCASLGQRMGAWPGIARLSSAIVLFSLALSIYQVHMPQGWVSIFVLLIIAMIQWRWEKTKFDLVVEQLRTRRKLRDIAAQDTLTGIANRRQFESALEAICRRREPFAVLLVDLDRFKRVNDTFGHAVGDTLLKLVADRLRAAVRATDIVARIGGDEFAVIQSALPNEATAQFLAKRINLAIAMPFEIEGHRIEIGASVGISIHAAGNNDLHQALRQADRALYDVKHEGGGGFRFAEQG